MSTPTSDAPGPSRPSEPGPAGRATAQRITRREKFVATTHDQLGVPLTRRGSIPDGEHLSPVEKLLMIALEVRGWNGGPCTASNAELAEAIGLQGSRVNQLRYVSKLLCGRKIRGGMRPGL